MKPTTPMKAIRLKCLDCSADQANEVRLCPLVDCPLYRYRSGKNPARAGKGGNPAHFGRGDGSTG